MKKIASLLLCLIMLFSLAVPTFAADKPIKVKLCNYTNPKGNWTSEKFISFDVQPQIINGRTMVPIRAIAEELGYEVGWNQSSQTVKIEETCCIIEDTKNCVSYKNYNQQGRIMNLWYNIEGNPNYMGKFTKLNKSSRNFLGENTNYKSLALGDFFNNAIHFRTTISFGVGKKVANLVLWDELMTDHAVYGVKGFYSYSFTSTYKLDSPAVIRDERTLVPLRAAAEMLGLDVTWDDSNPKYNLVTISA